MVCPAQVIVAEVTDVLAIPMFEIVRKLPAAEPQTKVMPALVERKSSDLNHAAVRAAGGNRGVVWGDDDSSPIIAKDAPQTTMTITMTATALVTL